MLVLHSAPSHLPMPIKQCKENTTTEQSDYAQEKWLHPPQNLKNNHHSKAKKRAANDYIRSGLHPIQPGRKPQQNLFSFASILSFALTVVGAEQLAGSATALPCFMSSTLPDSEPCAPTPSLRPERHRAGQHVHLRFDRTGVPPAAATASSSVEEKDNEDYNSADPVRGRTEDPTA